MKDQSILHSKKNDVIRDVFRLHQEIPLTELQVAHPSNTGGMYLLKAMVPNLEHSSLNGTAWPRPLLMCTNQGKASPEARVGDRIPNSSKRRWEKIFPLLLGSSLSIFGDAQAGGRSLHNSSEVD